MFFQNKMKLIHNKKYYTWKKYISNKNSSRAFTSSYLKNGALRNNIAMLYLYTPIEVVINFTNNTIFSLINSQRLLF